MDNILRDLVVGSCRRIRSRAGLAALWIGSGVLLIAGVTAACTGFGPFVGSDAGDGGEEGDASAESAANYSARVVASYHHDPLAFTQGLLFRDGQLFEGTGVRGRSSVRRVDLQSGEVLHSEELSDEYFGEGIALLNGQLFQLTWKSGVAFVYDPETLSEVDRLYYDGEGWGLTEDGQRLIMSNGSNTLTFRDPDTFAVQDRIAVMDGELPIDNLNELEMIDGEIYANVWETDRIARISVVTGRVLGWIDLGNLDGGPMAEVLNGIAYDSSGDRIFVTGKMWSHLYEVVIEPN